MKSPPAYFDSIRQRSVDRWHQLEQDRELAGPWHQLFKQVQSPRHVLSELLQNADDAGATEARVSIEDGRFAFSHNGEDFTEEHFASLCRFGYSNKRALHTIGFRGIGFKSTFSLGDMVELRTPTLAVAFGRKRFTEPRWLGGSECTTEETRISVEIGEQRLQTEIEKNLQDWLKSPVSLLFFRHIRRIRVGAEEAKWESLGPGPVPGTEWMALNSDIDNPFLRARSEPQEFPEDALAEINQERLLNDDEAMPYPASVVEIVLGAPGRLYVVLPTGVETPLPFACNAPFIQDPARLKVKDPEMSPTNRWLLERVGFLAASVMTQWLGDWSRPATERAQAYSFLPDVDRTDSSIEGACAAIVELAVDHQISERAYVLTESEELVAPGSCSSIPEELLEVWSAGQIAALLDDPSKTPLSRHITPDDRQKLANWGAVEVIEASQVVSFLETKHPPQPENWQQLLKLWAFVADEVPAFRHHGKARGLRLTPIQGGKVLYSANEVVRLGERRLLQSESDWTFLSDYLLVLNQNWTRFLAEQRRKAESEGDDELQEQVENAFGLLSAMGLDDSSDASKTIEQVAAKFFARETIPLKECVQLAQIAAKLNATSGASLRFAAQDRKLRGTKDGLLVDVDGMLQPLLPEEWATTHVLHADYTASYDSCTAEEWAKWTSASPSGIQTFVPLAQSRSEVWSRKEISAEVQKRGGVSAPNFPYVTNRFFVEDWDFDKALWSHWREQAKEDDRLWGRVVEGILGQSTDFWSKSTNARAYQVSTSGSSQSITSDHLSPAWLLRLRELPCLPDTRGFYHKPLELLRRTAETEPLLDVELFLDRRLDTESVQPLLIALGVGDTPTGPARLLERLRALARADSPPVEEVDKWYRRIDSIVESCGTADLRLVTSAFADDKLILTSDGGWTNAAGVFLTADDEDVPDAAVIRPSVRDLTLWRKVGVNDRPTADLAIKWLADLPSDEALSPADAKRVRALLAKHAQRIWEECGHWLTLGGTWTPTMSLKYALSLQRLVAWSHLHESIKRTTADFQRLPVETMETLPFSALPQLGSVIEERFHHTPSPASRVETKEWLNRLGLELCRIKLPDEEETTRIRKLAADLAGTAWHVTSGLELLPYIDGTPAGTPRRSEATWSSGVLYVEDRPLAKLALAVAQELGRSFQLTDVADAIKICFDRSPLFVTDYVEENFELIPHDLVNVPAPTVGFSNNGTGAVDVPVGSQAEARIAVVAGVVGDSQPFEDSDLATFPDVGVVDDGEESDEPVPSEDDEEINRATVRHPQAAPKPTIIEQFLRHEGYNKDTDDRYFHANGDSVSRVSGASFPWERRSAAGEVRRCYWPKDHCLEQQPLQLGADIWELLIGSPEKYALILADVQGDPVEIPGTRLLQMRDDRSVTLYPATYRLVYDHEA